MDNTRRHIVLIEDNPFDQRLMTGMLAAFGHRFELVSRPTLAAGLRAITELRPAAAIVDLNLPDSDGLKTFVRVHDAAPDLAVVVVTSTKDELQAEEAVRLGAQDYLVKGEVNPKLIYRSLRYAVERKAAEIELREKEIELRHAQRMESLGRLAGGIAHDFNNLLTVIEGYSELGLRETAEDHPAHKVLQQIRIASERGAGLTSQLLAFSRKQVIRPRALNANELLRGAEQMMRPLLTENIELVLEMVDDVWPVFAELAQLEQVVVNLMVNARDAMPDGGRLTVRTANRTLQDMKPRGADPISGAFVCIEVEDEGTGIPAEVLEQVFEPFFTTKPVDRGTGLGLSTVYGIVKQVGGYIHLSSEVGDGTRVSVYLPRAREAVPDTVAPTVADLPPTGRETVLVVEDVAAIRELLREILEERGYRPMVARSAEDALHLCEETLPGVDLLITDLVLPGMRGDDLVKRFRARRPELPVLFITGYADMNGLTAEKLPAASCLLMKPFTPSQLLSHVRQILDRGKDCCRC